MALSGFRFLPRPVTQALSSPSLLFPSPLSQLISSAQNALTSQSIFMGCRFIGQQTIRSPYRKSFKGRVGGVAQPPASIVCFGEYGLQATAPTRITQRQMEAARVILARAIKKSGSMWTRVIPNIPATSKPTEVRMGKGKGMVDFYYARVKKDKIIFEVSGLTPELAKDVFRIAGSKFPIKTKMVERLKDFDPSTVPEKSRKNVIVAGKEAKEREGRNPFEEVEAPVTDVKK